jgi:tRNAHis guanylyltransferase
MQFDDLDQQMRVFETAHDLCVLPGIWMVARLDGRNFTRLTRELRPFAAPFDERFRDLMLTTAEHLMTIGLFWETYAKQGLNPLTGESVAAQRQRIRRELELPFKDAYDAFLYERMAVAGESHSAEG